CRWKEQRGKVVGGKCSDQRQAGQDAAQRQYSLNSLAGRHHVVDGAKADAMSQEMTYRPARRFDRRFVMTRGAKPNAMRSGDPATKIGNRGDQGRPGLGRAVLVPAIVAERIEAQWVA